MITRSLSLALRTAKKSILLLGPRQTGKSTLMAELAPRLAINLAHEPTYLDFLRDPRLLEARLEPIQGAAIIFIDEIQRIPSLLNTIQSILDHPGNRFRFLLTGSSARKLKRGHANLLPGRIHTYHLGPLSANELNFQIDEMKAMSIGTLPGIWTEGEAAEREKTLRSYAATYLKEEVQAENLARNLEGFARFLSVSAEWSGRLADLSKIASLAQVPRQTVVRFFEVLEDSLIVFRLDPFAKSLSRRLVQHPRFFYFDVGVLNGLLGSFDVAEDRRGALFEHLVITQVFHMAHHLDVDARLSHFRTEHGAEVDLIVESRNRRWVIEVKSTRNVRPPDLRGLRSFRDVAGRSHREAVFYRGDHRLRLEGVDLFPWQEGLRTLAEELLIGSHR